MITPYIPSQDAAFDAFLTNLSALITATPIPYGLVAGDAVIIAASQTAFHAAYLQATNPTTRTGPNIAEKDAQRALAEATIRPYCQTIARNPTVSNELKTGLGLNLPNSSRTPVPPPSTQPVLTLASAIHFQHTLAYRDSATPTSKAKPPGAISCELWRYIGVAAISDPTQASLYGQVTKSPVNVGNVAPDLGKIATYFARWITRSGPAGQAQAGPFSAPLSAAIV